MEDFRHRRRRLPEPERGCESLGQRAGVALVGHLDIAVKPFARLEDACFLDVRPEPAAARAWQRFQPRWRVRGRKWHGEGNAARTRSWRALCADGVQKRQRRPPVTFGAFGQRALHRVGQRPPLAGRRVRGDRRHVSTVILAHVFHVAEQDPVVQEDRIIPDVRPADTVEDCREHVFVQHAVAVRVLGSQTDDAAERPR